MMRPVSEGAEVASRKGNEQGASGVDIPKLESAKFSNLDSVESNEHIIPGYGLSFTHSAAAIRVSLLFHRSWYVHRLRQHDDIDLQLRPLRCLYIPMKQRRPTSTHPPRPLLFLLYNCCRSSHRLLSGSNPNPTQVFATGTGSLDQLFGFSIMAEVGAPAELVEAVLDCGRTIESECYNKREALHLKGVAIAVIFIASALGVLIPLSGRRLRCLAPEGKPFFITKVFAAGVILATAFIHMLPTAQETLANPCLPEDPWGKFAWAGFIAMLGALGTLVLDFAATEFYLGRNKPVEGDVTKADSFPGDKVEKQSDSVAHLHMHEHDGDDHYIRARHIVVAQVFEFGVVAHSIIIGTTIGVSSSPCTIEPLFIALTFHQFFEGLALGGCIAMAKFKAVTAFIMGLCFAVTTSLGIAIGMGISSTYNENSPNALIVIGVFDSISAGILVYMALVDLIAVDFLSKRMRSSRSLQVYAFIALFLGCACMSVIGVWA